MNPYQWLWIAALAVFCVLEAVTTQMVCIWFAASSVVTLIFASLSVPLWLQLLVFAIFSAIFLIVTRPLVSKLLRGRGTPLNADRVLGETGLVITAIDNESAAGQVKVRGQIWTARSITGAAIPEGRNVTVHSIEGVKLIVEERPAP
jgi:membrane protein implicated in regulation of membrane protease activity